MFSKTTEYALRAVIHIAGNSSEEKKLNLDEIARAIDSPKPFTAKILQELTGKGNVISSVRGPKGGFYITEKQLKLPIRAILTATGEDERLNRCVIGLAACSEERPCPLHSRYKSVKAQLVSLFEDKTISELISDMQSRDTFINNHHGRTRKK